MWKLANIVPLWDILWSTLLIPRAILIFLSSLRTFGAISVWVRTLNSLIFGYPLPAFKSFKGPKFGIDGVRELLGVPERPLINNMLKPKTGHTPDVAADMCYKAAVGGVDIIKDDELIV